jgi:CheY-like chemotaxis protein
MTDELFSIRAIVVGVPSYEHEFFRQAASSSSVPIDVADAADAAAVRDCLGEPADLVFIDGAIGNAEVENVVSVLRAVPQPAFSVLMTGAAGPPGPFATDALAEKPLRLNEVRRLVERSIRVRLSSRVLVVDDSATMRSIVRKMLAGTRFPFRITEADGGFAALKMVRETNFDLVFLDYNLPEFNGLETLAEFKREKRRVSVVMMTSAASDAIVERAQDLGAEFLKKPFFPADIEAVLCGFYGFRALNPNRA